MSLSNPYRELPPARAGSPPRSGWKARWSAGLVGVVAVAAALVPAQAGSAAAAPPDYVEGGGACSSPTFYLVGGVDDDGSTVYLRYQFRYSYEINGTPASRYWRFVHAESVWSGTDWVPRQTAQTWICTTPSPVPAPPATPTPPPTPPPTPDPTPPPTPTPDPSDPPGWDCGDGLVVAPDELPWLVEWVAANTELTAEEQAALEAQPCSFLAYFGDVETEFDPEPATVVVGGGGAPIGRFAAPARENGACPLYRREVKLVLGRGFKVDFEGPKRNFVQRAADRVWHLLGNAGSAPSEFAEGDVILSLKLRLRVCTDGAAVTAVDPPAGGSPGYEAIVSQKGAALGYAPPNGVLAQSHGYVDAAGDTTFKSRVQVAFDYTSPIGIELPIKFRSNTFSAEITVYQDGTWDYAVSGGGTIGG